MDKNSLILTLLKLNKWGPKKVYDYVMENNLDYEKSLNSLSNALSDFEKIIFKEKLVEVKKQLLINNEKGINCITLLDADFPKKLYNAKDKCLYLFYVGNIELLNKPSITIIGTRTPDDNYIDKGIIVSKYFARKGYVIVSGLALGCDRIAHRACIDVNGDTIAVLPSSCDNPQPISNKKLAQEIVANGGLLISEYASGEKIGKYNFPRRDRIQSLLSNVVLVIEASDNSGTMNAVKKSLDDNKKVYAIEGNHISLIKNYVNANDEYQLKAIENNIK